MKDKILSVVCLFILIMGSAIADKGKPYPSKGSGPMMDGHGSMMNDNWQGQRAYGWQLMTEEERLQHRERMHSAKSYEEQEQYWQEHREEMLKRAKERGVELPDSDDSDEYQYRYKKK